MKDFLRKNWLQLLILLMGISGLHLLLKDFGYAKILSDIRGLGVDFIPVVLWFLLPFGFQALGWRILVLSWRAATLPYLFLVSIVAFAWNTHPRWRLLLAGNRDEFHARPSAALARWPESGVFAGRDLRSGGTWVGIDRRGRMAVVTNVRDGFAQAHTGPSRGALPLAFLAGAADAAATTVIAIEHALTYRVPTVLAIPYDVAARDAGPVPEAPEPRLPGPLTPN